VIDRARPARARTRAAGIVILLAVLGLSIALAGRAAAVDEDSDGNLSVIVTDDQDSTPRPTPTPSTTPRVTPTTPPRANAPTGGVGQATVTPTGVGDALGPDPVIVEGVYAMSGLTVSASPSIAPANSAVTLSFSVRNSSSTMFDATARVWITSVFGTRLASLEGIAIDGLAPDETRRVSATVWGLGQSALLNGHVTFTPPAEIEGTALSPVTRDTFFVLAPLFALLIAGGVAGAATGVWWLLKRSGGVLGVSASTRASV